MFNRLVGNDNVKHTLKRLIENDRVPNSFLFAGPEGVGKRQFALELARSFICKEPSDREGCGVCTVCLRVSEFVIPEPAEKTKDEFKRVFFGGHSDVGKVVPYKRTILVDAIRDLERHANFLPYEARSRFFIIAEADRMNDEAANALLKTLEEPAPTTHIFLVTARPDSLLPTVRSRCQTLRFAPVAVDAIEKHLITERAFTTDEARLAARLSRGSVGRAVSIDIAKLRMARERMLAVIANAIESRDRAALLRAAEEMNDSKNRDSFEENLDILQTLIYDTWRMGVSRDMEWATNADLADRLFGLSAKADPSVLTRWLSDIDLLRENLIVNINRKIGADALFVGMTV
jgi:DNA polymerase-3 subunit delta'